MGKDSKVVEEIARMVKDFLREQGIEPGRSEEMVRDLLHQAGAAALGSRWSEQAAEEEPEWIECSCGNQVRRRGWRKKRFLTLLGQTEATRSYYWCRECGEGRFLLDERLGCRGRAQTGSVQECVALAISEETYAGGSRLLSTLAGLEIPHYTLEEIILELGNALGEERDRCIDQALEGELISDEKPETLCAMIDGGKVRTDDDWHEARVVTVFPYEIPPGGSEAEHGRISYTARVENCEAAGRRLYAEAVRRGALSAKRLAVVGDGAEWIWNQVREHFPEAIEILDWFHVMEHLWQVANELFGEGSQEARDWKLARSQELERGKVSLVINKLRGIFWKKRRNNRKFKGSDLEHVLSHQPV